MILSMDRVISNQYKLSTTLAPSITISRIHACRALYGINTPIIVTLHLPTPAAGRARVGIIGDLQESFDKFPTLGGKFMLQIPYILYRDYKNNTWTNTLTLGTNYANKSLQIPTHCPT